jgi:glycosyltransferase involved in cell wall biosynthesis
MKKVILIRHGEVTPVDDVSPRYLRTGQMFFHFIGQTKRCVWYTSTFNHFSKSHRSNETFHKKINDHGEIIYINSPGYKKNISVSRLYDHFVWGGKVFWQLYKNRKDIDIIITSIPTIFSTFLVVLLSKIINVKVVVEVRDKWPDIFWMSAKGFKRKVIRFCSLPLKFMVKWSVENCTVCTVPSPSFDTWLQTFVNKKSTKKIQLSFLGYKKEEFTSSASANAIVEMMQKDANGRKIISFIGTVGHMFDLETIVQAAEKIDAKGEYFFAMFGSGDTLPFWQERTKGRSNIKFYGWTDKQSIDGILTGSFIGLAPYVNNDNFKGHVPNKIMEYSAYGLPILSSLEGYVNDYLEDNNFGATFINKNVNSLIDGINKIEENAKNYSDISKNMISYYESNFMADTIYDSLYSLVKSL